MADLPTWKWIDTVPRDLEIKCRRDQGSNANFPPLLGEKTRKTKRPFLYKRSTDMKGAITRNPDGTLKIHAIDAYKSDIAQALSELSISGEGFRKRCYLYYFRNLDLDVHDVQILVPEVSPHATQFLALTATAKTHRGDLEKACFGSKFLFEFVKKNREEYNALAIAKGCHVAQYHNLSVDQQNRFWLASMRFNKEMVLRMWEKVGSEVDLGAVWDSDGWKKWIRRVYLVACRVIADEHQCLWECDCDLEVVYAAMRKVYEMLDFEVPPYNEIPVKG